MPNFIFVNDFNHKLVVYQYIVNRKRIFPYTYIFCLNKHKLSKGAKRSNKERKRKEPDWETIGQTDKYIENQTNKSTARNSDGKAN